MLGERQRLIRPGAAGEVRKAELFAELCAELFAELSAELFAELFEELNGIEFLDNS